MNEIKLQNNNGMVLASSREVAEKFEKEHDKVCRDIKNMLKFQPTKLSIEFSEHKYVSDRGRTYTEYLMTRDGFSLLCMGFTGRKAFDWKLKYIEAFNMMDETIKSGSYLSEEEKLRLQLFSRDSLEVVNAHNKLVELATAPLIAENEVLKPKAEFHDAIEVSRNCVNFGKFAAILQNSKNIKLGRNVIMDWCRENGYLCSSRELKNKPSQRMLSSGYMQYKENINEFAGVLHTNYTPLLTGKGQTWLTKQLINEMK